MFVKTVEGFSLSSHQKRIWELQDVYNIPFYNHLTLKIQGKLSIPDLTDCFINTINQYEILRSRLQKVEGMEYPIQVILEKAYFSFSYNSNLQDEEELQVEALDIVRQKLQAENGGTVHINISKISEYEHGLNIYGLSLNTDFISLQLIVNHAFKLYTTNQSVAEEEIIQYVDFSQWQNELLENDRISYKTQIVRNALPFERLKESSTESNRQSIRNLLPEELSMKIRELAQLYNLDVPTFFFASWKAFLSKVACHNLPVGLVVDGRNYEELKLSIGQFEKVIPIEVYDAQQTFIQYNKQVQEHLTKSMEKVEYVDISTLFSGSEDYIPYQFRYLDNQVIAQQGDITLTMKDFRSENEKYKLLLSVLCTNESFELFLQFDGSMYLMDDVERLFSQFLFFLNQCIKKPHKELMHLSFLTKQEEERLIVKLNTDRYSQLESLQKNNILDYIEEQAELNGDLLAIVSEDKSITYRELQSKTNQLTRYLKRFLEPEDRVVLCMPRSAEAIISMLAVLKSGASFVPVDSKWPINRIRYAIEDSAAKMVLTNKQSILDELKQIPVQQVNLSKEWKVIKKENESCMPSVSLLPQQLAYVLYTSGSTGLPKGVCIQHTSLLNYLLWFDQQFSDKEIELPFMAELGFDAFLKQVFYPLMKGKRVTLFSEDEVLQPLTFLNRFLKHQLNAINCVPSLWTAFIEEIRKDDRVIESVKAQLRLLLIGGEKISNELLQMTWNIFPDLEVVNLYGPTETTSNATYAYIKNELFIPIGIPIRKTQTYVFDEEMHTVAIGQIGELYIGGIGVARGYFGNSGMTAERFIPNPFESGERLYKTGDLVRLMANGELEFIGRKDEQIKMNGKRVDLNEIETVIRKHPSIKDTVIIPMDDQGLSLLAFCVGEIVEEDIREFTKKWLPQYMIPTKFIRLNEIPLNSNRKINRASLIQFYEKLEVEKYVAPRNEFEEVIVGIWKEVLKKKQVSVADSFFELGGHSLNATQIISRIRKIYELEIPVSLLFEAETTEKLCQGIYRLYPQESDYINLVSKAYLEAEKLAMEEVSF